MTGSDERVVDDFWDSYGAKLVSYLDALDIQVDDVIVIMDDIMTRCEGIPAAIGTSVKSDKFWFDFSSLIFEMVSAEQRLMQARTSRVPGRLIDDTWPPTPITFEHPFLAAVQHVVNQIEAEANKGEYARSAN